MEKLTALIKELVHTIARSTKLPLIGWDEDRNQFSVQVDPNDQGRIIGKNGVAISALNVVMWHAGKQHIGRPVGIRLLEPNGQRKDDVSVPFMPKEELDIQTLKSVTAHVLEATIGDGNCSWTYTANVREPITAHVCIKKSLEKRIADPDLISALKVIIKTVGRSCGGIVDSVIYFNK